MGSPTPAEGQEALAGMQTQAIERNYLILLLFCPLVPWYLRENYLQLRPTLLTET